MTTVGTGKYTYRLIQDWPKLPPSQSLSTTSSVATDSQDRVYVFQRGEPPVWVFDREGSYLNTWGHGSFIRPHGCYIQDDVIYLTDTDDSVAMRYTLDGRLLQIIGKRGQHSDSGTDVYGDLVPRAAPPFNHPTGLVPSPSGDLYAADGEKNCRVHRFTSDGKLVSSWGEPGKMEPNQFHLVHGIVVDGEGRVYVCDRENARVQVFDSEGNVVSVWTDLRPPTDIAMDSEGAFYVSQFGFNTTHRYEGYPPPTGSGSALKDEQGRRTVRPDGPPRISIFDRDGNVLASWESRKAHGLWVDAHGDIYTAVEDEKSVDKYMRVS